MDSKGTLIIFDTPGKNCPLNILAPTSISLQIVTWGGAFSRLSRNTTFFNHAKRIGEAYSFFGLERGSVK